MVAYALRRQAMKTAVLFAAVALAGTAMANVDVQAGDLARGHQYTLGEGSPFGARATPGASYSNIDTYSGQAYSNGGSTAGITRMVCDDLTFALPYLAGQSFTSFTFSVSNLNTVAVSARPRVRFWRTVGAGGGPGTYYSAIGYTFNAISFGANSVGLFTGNIGPGFLQPAAGQTLWAGITFDNNGGATGATNDQLNLLGQGIFSPPAVGSSADTFWSSTVGGSFFNVNNPAGSQSNFGGNPAANFGWEFNVPTPGSIALLGMGGLLAARRRRA
jgi:hypothetical protein